MCFVHGPQTAHLGPDATFCSQTMLCPPGTKVTGQLKTNNAKLKGVITKMRSSRNFCVDVILICIILAIGECVQQITLGNKLMTHAQNWENDVSSPLFFSTHSGLVCNLPFLTQVGSCEFSWHCSVDVWHDSMLVTMLFGAAMCRCLHLLNYKMILLKLQMTSH